MFVMIASYLAAMTVMPLFASRYLYPTQRDIWSRLAHESGIITKEAQNFVDTGQRSIVDRYLSKAQTEEARTAEAFFGAQYKESIHVLAAIMGVSDSKYSCPSLPEHLTASLDPNIGIESSPLLTRAIIGAKVAQARLEQQKAGYYPKIVAVASAGSMADARLVPKKDYAAGIGIVLPLFDLHTGGEIHKAQAVASARQQEVEAEKQYLEEMNAKYNEIIVSSEVRLKHLNYESALADKAFSTAKKRYFSLEGELIDLREAFRNIARVDTEIEATRTKLLQAKGSKALLNGSG